MMSNEEKLKRFESAALLKAEQRRDTINAELDKATSEALAESRKKFRRESAKTRSKALSEARKEARLIVSTAQNRGQTALMAKRNEIIDQVFSKLIERLQAFVASDEYESFFAKRISEALNAATLHLGESNSGIYIDVTESDSKKYADLIERISDKVVVWAFSEVRVTKEDIIGGCVVRVPSLGLVIDNSIKADVLREHEDFLSWSNISLS